MDSILFYALAVFIIGMTLLFIVPYRFFFEKVGDNFVNKVVYSCFGCLMAFLCMIISGVMFIIGIIDFIIKLF